LELIDNDGQRVVQLNAERESIPTPALHRNPLTSGVVRSS